MADSPFLNEDELITRRAVRALKRAAPFAVVAASLAFAAAFLLAGVSDPKYKSEGAIELTDDRAAGISSSRSRTDALQEIDGRVQRIEGAAFFGEVAAALDSEQSAQLLDLGATANESTPVIKISATASTPSVAVAGVDAAIGVFIADRDAELKNTIESELVALRAQREDQLAAISALSDEIESVRETGTESQISILENRTASSLSRLASFDTAIQEREFLAESANGQVRVVNQAGDPSDVATNRIARPLQLAVLVLVLVLIGSVVVSRLRGRLHLLDEVRAVAGPDIPILATVPKFRKKFRDGPAALVVGRRNARREAEAFRYLRTSIEVATNMEVPLVVAFTSASANEGKSVTAANYALATARAERTVAVLDGDLLNSSVADLFEAEGQNAFLALMNGEVDATTEKWHRISTSGSHVDLMVSRKMALSGGRQELPTVAVERSLEKLVQAYDTVVLDCPPVLAISDAMVLTRSADVAVMVVRMGRTTRRDLDKALTQLEQNRIDIAGIVITHSTDESESYYGYGYAYGGRDD